MSVAALKELQGLFGKFEHAYLKRHEEIDHVVNAVMEVASCLSRLRAQGNIGAYLEGMDLVDRFYRETPLQMLLEDERDPLIMKSIAEHYPVHTPNSLCFFMDSSDTIMQSAVRSFVQHLQVASAFTLKDDAYNLARRLASNGMNDALDDLLIFFRDISKHERQIMNEATFRAVLCGAFEGLYESEDANAASPKLTGLANEYLGLGNQHFEILIPKIEAAMGLAKTGFHEMADALALCLYPRTRTTDYRIILEMERCGLSIKPILGRATQAPTAFWSKSFVTYALLTNQAEVDVTKLDMVDTTNKAMVKKLLLSLPEAEAFNQGNAQALMSAFGRLYPNEGREFAECKLLRPLALRVDGFRDSAFSADLGI